jgi:hypothetical protein
MSDFIDGIDFGQATPKPEGVWAKKGSMGPRFEQVPMTSEAPETGFIETDHSVRDIRERGYHTPGTPGNDDLTDAGDTRSNMS